MVESQYVRQMKVVDCYILSHEKEKCRDDTSNMYSCCTAAISSQYNLQPRHFSEVAAVHPQNSLKVIRYCYDAAAIRYCDAQTIVMYYWWVSAYFLQNCRTPVILGCS